MGLEVVEISGLQVCKFKIALLGRLAHHYFLSEHNNLDHSIGWGPAGLEVRGRVRVTRSEQQRIERFVATARYDIAINNGIGQLKRKRSNGCCSVIPNTP